MTNVKYNEIDTKELTAWTSSCGCNSSGSKCLYHIGKEEGYRQGKEEKIFQEAARFNALFAIFGIIIGVCITNML